MYARDAILAAKLFVLLIVQKLLFYKCISFLGVVFFFFLGGGGGGWGGEICNVFFITNSNNPYGHVFF